MSIPLIRQGLAAGEISPALFGEVSLAKFSIAASTLRNCYVSYRGGADSRAGTAYCLLSKTTFASGFQPRVITFQYKTNQGYALELGANYMRFFFQGAPILEAAKTVSGATQASTCVITATGHGFSNGDWVYISGITTMTQLNGRFFLVAGVTANTFQIDSLFTGSGINSTGYTAYGSGGGAVARVYTLSTPYAGGDVQFLKFTESADTMSITHPSYMPYDLARISPASWTLTAATFGSSVSAPTAVFAVSSAQPSQATAPATLPCAYSYVVTAVDAKGNESNASPVGSVTNAVDMAITANSITVTWSPVTGAASYNIYRAPTSYNSDPGNANNALPVPPGSIFSYVGTSLGVQFVDSNTIPDTTTGPPTHQNPFAPSAVLYVTPTAPGSALSPNATISITTSTGSGAVVQPIIVAGQFVAAMVLNGGTLYAAGTDTMSVIDPGYFATGNIAFSVNPSASDTIALNSVTWTFVTSVTAAAQTLIGPTLSETLVQLALDVSESTNAALTVASYVASGSQLNVTYNTGGSGGNAYTLAASAATPSGANLSGGGGGGSGATGTLTIGPATGTYPSVVAYYQQRRTYANSNNQPDTFWMSRPGKFLNFDTTIPTNSADAISATPWSQQVNGVQWLITEPGGLVVMTGNGAWQVSGGGSPLYGLTPISPSNDLAVPQTFSGVSPIVPPITINNDILYVQEKGFAVRAMAYSYFTNNYAGTDQTVLSGQLFEGHTIHEWAWCEEPYKVVWAVRDDGVMLSLTYQKEQEVFGWARHDTEGRFISVCSVNEVAISQRTIASGGTTAPLISVDALYTAVERFTPNGVFYFIERMDDRIWNGMTENSWCVDAALTTQEYQPGIYISATVASGAGEILATQNVFSSNDVGAVIRVGGGIFLISGYTSATIVSGIWLLPPSQIVPGVTATTQFLSPYLWSMSPVVSTVSGLDHLAGLAVSGVVDGVPVQGLSVSSDGVVTLPVSGSLVTLGLPFLPQAQSTYLDAGNPTIQARRKDIIAATARVASSYGVQIGVNQPDGSVQQPPTIAPVWANMQTGQYVDPEDSPQTYVNSGGQTVSQLFTGDIRTNVDSDWVVQGQVAVQQPLPLPMSLLAFVPELLEGDVPETGYSPQQRPQRAAGHEGPSGWMLR